MRTYTEHLNRYGWDLQVRRPELSYVTRAEIERALFLTCSRLAKDYYGYELRSFTLNSHEEIEDRQRITRADPDVITTILLAFELKAVLSNLASGDPYMSWDLGGPSLVGRDSAIRVFGKQLQRYASRLSDLCRD